jgi:hypothetical protein
MPSCCDHVAGVGIIPYPPGISIVRAKVSVESPGRGSLTSARCRIEAFPGFEKEVMERWSSTRPTTLGHSRHKSFAGSHEQNLADPSAP